MSDIDNFKDNFVFDNAMFKKGNTKQEDDEIIQGLLTADFQFFEKHLKQFADYLPNDIREEFIKQEYEYLTSKFDQEHSELNTLIIDINNKVNEYYDDKSTYNTTEYINSFNQLVKKYKKLIIDKFNISDTNSKYYVYYKYLTAHHNIYNNINVNQNFTNTKINSYLESIKTNINDYKNLKVLKDLKI